jgi:uncharacterized membrane protein
MIQRTHLLILLALLLLTLVATAAVYPSLPATVPMHWNIRGQVDGYGPRWQLVLILPCFLVLMVLMLLVLPVIGPMRRNFERFRRTCGRIAITLVGAFGAIQITLLLAGLGKPIAVGRVLFVILGVMIAVLGNWMGKVRRNFYVGIRTPWTLANERVWERTHRAGGKFMVIYGATIAASVLALPEWAGVVVLLSGALALVVWSLAYSSYVYHHLNAPSSLK